MRTFGTPAPGAAGAPGAYAIAIMTTAQKHTYAHTDERTQTAC